MAQAMQGNRAASLEGRQPVIEERSQPQRQQQVNCGSSCS
jgi:hypothetical protein